MDMASDATPYGQLPLMPGAGVLVSPNNKYTRQCEPLYAAGSAWRPPIRGRAGPMKKAARRPCRAHARPSSWRDSSDQPIKRSADLASLPCGQQLVVGDRLALGLLVGELLPRGALVAEPLVGI